MPIALPRRRSRLFQWLFATTALAALLFHPGSAHAAARAESSDEAPDVSAREAGVALEAGLGTQGATEFRRAGARDPALIVSVLDGRDENGHWWLLATALAAGRFELTLANREDGSARVLRFDAEAPRTLLFDHAAPARRGGLKVTLDPARAVSKSIGATGGTLQATAANGARFTLTIPPRALLFPETITLTPIKSIAGLPLTPGLAGGVEIGPSGLRFQALAALSIQPVQPVALAAETTFGYRLGGSLFFLYPAALGQRPVRLDVLHTGGYGLAAGKASEQAAQLKKTPARLEDQFDQGLWKAHWQLRQSLSAATTAAPSGNDLDYYQNYFDDKAGRWADLVAASCAGRKQYANSLRNYVRKAVADGVGGQLGTEIGQIKQALKLGAVHCYAEAVQACNAGDGKQPVPALQWWHELEDLGGTSLVSSSTLETCLTFMLEWKTTFSHSSPAPEGYMIRARHEFDTHATIHFHPPFAFGSAPPTPNGYLQATYTGGAPRPCTRQAATGNLKPDVFSVPEMILDVNQYEDNPPPLKIELTYATGNPQMQLQATGCPNGTSGAPFFAGLFAPAYLGVHFFVWHDAAIPPVGYTYEPRVDWNVTYGSNPWASLKFQGSGLSAPPVTANEDTALNLFHRPGS